MKQVIQIFFGRLESICKNKGNDRQRNSQYCQQTVLLPDCQQIKSCSSEWFKTFVDSSREDRFDGLSCVSQRFLKESSNQSTNNIMALWRKSTSIK